MLTTILLLIWFHFVSDFLLQTDSMALNKSSSNKWLVLHVLVYGIPFHIFFGWKYALFNVVAHFVTDYCTSRATTKLYKAGQRHWFFVVIGLDQAIHMTCLLLSYGLIE